MAISTVSLSSQINAYAITVSPTLNPTTIKNALLAGGGTGIDPTSVVVTISGNSVGGASSVGTYVNPTNTYGIGDGIVMSSGNVTDYNDGPNLFTDRTTDFGTVETPAQKALLDPITGVFNHTDVTQIDVTFNMLPGHNTVFFNTVFGSEEYPEYVGSVFIDGFGLFVNGANIAFVNGNPVNINHPDMGVYAGTELDGILLGSNGTLGPAVHTFSAPVNPTGNKMTFIIADSSDHVLDSTVYISGLGGSAPPPPTHIDTVLSHSTITLGNSFTDNATLIGVTANASGTITYNVYNTTASCTGTPLFTSTTPVTNAKATPSSPFTPTIVGTYNVQAVYSGDNKNPTMSSDCASEKVTVVPVTTGPTITTHLSNSTIYLGRSVIDSATLTGVTPEAGGTVTYKFLFNCVCNNPPEFTSKVTVTNGTVPDSAPFTPSHTGRFVVKVVYSGDEDNKGATNKPGSEHFRVLPLTIKTHLSRPSVVVGHTIRDYAYLFGFNSGAGGTVTYNIYSGNTCSGTPVFSDVKPVTNGIVPKSAYFKPAQIGTYNAQAVYSGDSNNAGATSLCGTETFQATSVEVLTKLPNIGR